MLWTLWDVSQACLSSLCFKHYEIFLKHVLVYCIWRLLLETLTQLREGYYLMRPNFGKIHILLCKSFLFNLDSLHINYVWFSFLLGSHTLSCVTLFLIVNIHLEPRIHPKIYFLRLSSHSCLMKEFPWQSSQVQLILSLSSTKHS